jgi:cysteine-rich repeat protein
MPPCARPHRLPNWAPLLGILLVALCGNASPAYPGTVQGCPGDCDGSQRVTVSELVRGSRINLGRDPVTVCPAFDIDGDGAVGINEIVAAVNALLDGCPAAPPPTRRASATATPTCTATDTATPTATRTAADTATPTETGTPTLTASASPTASPSATPSLTATPRQTPPLSQRVCGNGTIEPGEECDDDNLQAGDGCSAACRSESHPDPCADVTPVAGTDVTAVRVAGSLSLPLYATSPPGDTSRLFIVEQSGRIRLLKDGRVQSTPFLDLRDRVVSGGERGLLGLAFHPAYASNGECFVDYTTMRGPVLMTVVSRFHVSDDPDVADPNSEEILLEQEQPFIAHNGGQLAFDALGYLYISFGDGGQSSRSQNTAQDPTTWLGKILRIDVDGGAPYAIPLDNPYVGPDGVLDEIWTMGHRNPWRFSFDRATGDAYIGDVGEGTREEIDVVPAGSGGENFGWCCREGTTVFAGCFDAAQTCPAAAALTPPVLEYGHDVGCSVTGGFVYRGCALPDLRGNYFYGDYCTDFVRSFTYQNNVVADEQDWTARLTPAGGLTIDRIAGFGEDARGEIYVCDLGGEVFKIVPAPVP